MAVKGLKIKGAQSKQQVTLVSEIVLAVIPENNKIELLNETIGLKSFFCNELFQHFMLFD